MARHSGAEIAAGFAVILIAIGFLSYAAANTGRGSVAGLTLNAEFDNVGSLVTGAEVRMAGIKVGQVLGMHYDPATSRAHVDFTVQSDIKLPTDSSAQIATSGLLGGASLMLVPGGAPDLLAAGQTVQITQSAANLEDLLGKFIFNVGSLADASQKQLQRDQARHPEPSP